MATKNDILRDKDGNQIFPATMAEQVSYDGKINVKQAIKRGAVRNKVAPTVASMTDKEQIYVYTGTEDGYTFGNWYYWDGTAWTSGGAYNAIEVNTDGTLTEEGAPADAKATGDKLTELKDDLSNETIRATNRENEIESLFTMPTQEAVNKWLNDHPDATTTVQDSSLEVIKFTEDAKLHILKDYVTPQMFGAKGDGETDDTLAFQNAVNTKKPVLIPSGTSILIEGTVSLNNSTIIYGCGTSSEIKIFDNGTIITDTDKTHTLEMFDIKVTVRKSKGNAIHFYKESNFTPKTNLYLHDIHFFMYNNFDENMDSNVLCIKGTQSASILNCVFEGQVKSWGTFIKMETDSTHATMNITVNTCNFYNAKYGIYLDNNYENFVYLCGIRMCNNCFINMMYGVKAVCIDTFWITDSMLDYCDHPIDIDSCGTVYITNNYLQTRETNNALIYFVNNINSVRRYITISNNNLYCTNGKKDVDGILFEGITNQNGDITFLGNKGHELNRMFVLKNASFSVISNNACHNSNVFIDGNSDSVYLNVNNNICENTDTFVRNIHDSCKIANGNIFNSVCTENSGKNIFTGNGSKREFVIPHGLIKEPVWAVASMGGNYGGYAVQYDSEGVKIVFETAPTEGRNVIINWYAKCYMN